MNATGRRFCLVLAVVSGVVLMPAVALADTPAGWEDSPNVSGLQFLLVLFLFPLALALAITLLALIPGWVKPSAYEQGEPWVGDDEWFGGPQHGIEGSKPKQLAGADEQGGAGARF